MKYSLAAILSAIGAFIALVSSSGCFIIYADEPTMPEEML